LGGPCILKWQGPPAPPIRGVAFKGDREMREAAEQLRQVSMGPDKGGWLLWTVLVADGRLPVVKRQELAAGLTVMGSGEVVPLWARSADGFTLKQDGSVRQPDPVTACPPWLLAVFGAKWERVRR
jgi:hypothetical protein